MNGPSVRRYIAMINIPIPSLKWFVRGTTIITSPITSQADESCSLLATAVPRKTLDYQTHNSTKQSYLQNVRNATTHNSHYKNKTQVSAMREKKYPSYMYIYK